MVLMNVQINRPVIYIFAEYMCKWMCADKWFYYNCFIVNYFILVNVYETGETLVTLLIISPPFLSSVLLTQTGSKCLNLFP